MSRSVAIIGAGPLGRWLALSAARAGFCVLLEDVMPANLHHAQEYIRAQLGPGQVRVSLPDLAGVSLVEEQRDSEGGGGFNPRITPVVAMRALAPEEQPAGNPNITYVSTIEDAVREADLAIDCVPDELESKLEILWLLDRMAPPRTVFATPTTRLSIADLAACTYRPEKCVAIAAEARDLAGNSGAEILLRTTLRTTPETIALLENFWRRLGFTPTFQEETVVSGQ